MNYLSEPLVHNTRRHYLIVENRSWMIICTCRQSKTWKKVIRLFCVKDGESQLIKGYFTLSNSAISLDHLPASLGKKATPGLQIDTCGLIGETGQTKVIEIRA